MRALWNGQYRREMLHIHYGLRTAVLGGEVGGDSFILLNFLKFLQGNRLARIPEKLFPDGVDLNVTGGWCVTDRTMLSPGPPFRTETCIPSASRSVAYDGSRLCPSLSNAVS